MFYNVMTHFGPSAQTQISNQKKKKKMHILSCQINRSSQSTTLYNSGALTYTFGMFYLHDLEETFVPLGHLILPIYIVICIYVYLIVELQISKSLFFFLI